MASLSFSLAVVDSASSDFLLSTKIQWFLINRCFDATVGSFSTPGLPKELLRIIILLCNQKLPQSGKLIVPNWLFTLMCLFNFKCYITVFYSLPILFWLQRRKRKKNWNRTANKRISSMCRRLDPYKNRKNRKI